jgi:ribose/xylose/arabinose/galactoside ABC-type transport system permease subunit
MKTSTRVLLTLLLAAIVATMICLFAGFRYGYLYVLGAFPALLVGLSRRSTRAGQNRRAR